MTETTLTHGAPFEPDYVLTPETDRNAWSDKRTITARWVGKPSEGLTDREPNAVELTIAHYKGSKRYTVTITAGTASGMSFAFDLMRGVTRISDQPAARYNRKDLQAIADAALADFPNNIPEGSAAAEAWAAIVAHHSESGLEPALSADPTSAGLPDFFEEAAAV